MKQRDVGNTGRADFVVPASRQDGSFFSILRWQKRSPGSPNEGNFDASSMAFFDAVGPGGTDVVAAGYHWPKGVQGMDRHTGKLFWNGNPGGGETIGVNTPAFSLNGSVVYITNDATAYPLMAFHTAVGPSVFWDNNVDPNPGLLGAFSPRVAPDGRIFVHCWNDRPYGATDFGTYLSNTWGAATGLCACYSNPALFDDGDTLTVVSTGRCGWTMAFDGVTGAELWRVSTGFGTDADPTIDPLSGDIYVPLSANSVYVLGLDRNGNQLWATPTVCAYQWINGVNNPQRTCATGCLSQDGATYYFETVSAQGDGALYAINTVDGSVRWTLNIGSSGWEGWCSNPIVTPNGVIIVGNNGGGTYYAVRDDVTEATVLDTFAVSAGGNACASATLSPDGLLYLPLRTLWISSNGDGEAPSFEVENVYSAFDVNAGAVAQLPPPANQCAVALNHAVSITWREIIDPSSQFHHYAVFRATSPFTSVAGKTPIGTVTDIHKTDYLDSGASNGVHYYYAVTSVSIGGGGATMVQSIGPRTPHDKTDLQVATLARTPRYPRYLPTYNDYWVTEPSGFGPYLFSAATGLGGGQTPSTQRWPNVGDGVTYVATVRNSGTNAWTGTLSGMWRKKGVVVANPSQSVSLQPNDTTTFTYVDTWDNTLYELQFTLNLADAVAYNNSRTIQTKSAPLLTFVDVGFMEDFREISTPAHPQSATDDMIDWLQRHADEMNDMFAAAGGLKRVHYDVLQTVHDGDPNPAIDLTPFGIFPLRYESAAPSYDPRSPGYYHSDVDIDYGLCHELSHQLGLIDVYVFNFGGDANRVSSLPYSPAADLMLGCSPLYSPFSAGAMNRWINIVHGYYGQFMYDIPAQVNLRVLDYFGDPLPNATVKMYQFCNHPDGSYISTQIKAQGVTDASGIWTLPNVPIDPGLVPPTDAGVLHDNPFGYVAVVGTNAVLHFRIESGDFVDYAWLSLPDVNLAYWSGEADLATFDRQTIIGGPIQNFPPADMAEMNVENWTAWSQDGTVALANDTSRKHNGAGSIRFDTTGGFDNAVRYPIGIEGRWNLTNVNYIRFWVYAVNPNYYFQSLSPWVRLGNYADGYFQWTPSSDVLNNAVNRWYEFVVPVNGNATWTRSTFGTPSLSRINYLEIHADTWGYGFPLWLDGVRFDPSPQPVHGDTNCDGAVDFDDINPFVLALVGLDSYYAQYPNCAHENADCNGDGAVDFDDINPFVTCLVNSGCP